MAKYVIDANGNQVLEDQTDLNGSAAGGTADPFQGQSFTSVAEQVASIGEAADEWAALKTEVEADQEQRATDFDEYMGGLTNDVFAHPDARLVRLRTAGGQATDFFRFPAITWGQLRPDSAEFGTITDMHEAFCDGTEAASGDHAFEAVYIAAYPMSLSNGEVVSQPGQRIYNGRTFDQAIADCQGTEIVGFEGKQRLWSIWDRSLVVNHCMASGFQPVGNTAYGFYHDDFSLSGLQSGNNKIYTGTMGPLSSHSGTSHGIYDLVGNTKEYCYGLETFEGRLAWVADNRSLTADRSDVVERNLYYSHIEENGKFELLSNSDNQIQNGPTGFSSYPGSGGFSGAAVTSNTALVRALISPVSDGNNPDGNIRVKTYGDQVLAVGGRFDSGGNAGLGTIELMEDGALAYYSFRAAFAV